MAEQKNNGAPTILVRFANQMVQLSRNEVAAKGDKPARAFHDLAFLGGKMPVQLFAPGIAPGVYRNVTVEAKINQFGNERPKLDLVAVIEAEQ